MTRQRQSTLIRNERKRAAFEFQAPNKKPGIVPGFYNSAATGSPHKAPVANRNTPRTEVLSHELYS